jgi:hypothetical protein
MCMYSLCERFTGNGFPCAECEKIGDEAGKIADGLWKGEDVHKYVWRVGEERGVYALRRVIFYKLAFNFDLPGYEKIPEGFLSRMRKY